MSAESIRVRGAAQHNLKNLDIDLPLGALVVVTGVSGSGKSSLAFDTVYAEGQRRYVETFSPYARQFLDRMDKPRVERIEGIPAAIAIDQVNPVRTSRSTVGTMTELNDHLKLLFARAARLYCRSCGAEVRRDTAQSIADALLGDAPEGAAVLVCFAVPVPESFSEAEVRALLARQGYDRVHRASAGGVLEVVQGRARLAPERRERLVEALEAALQHGQGRVTVYPLDAERRPDRAGARRFSRALHCAHCDLDHQDARAAQFSFNSPIGACPSCRGFGRTMGIDWGLVVPDPGKSLAGGAVKPFTTRSFAECQKDLLRYAKARGIALERPWAELDEQTRRWVLEGEGGWDDGVWYGVQRFFDWLESKSYRMHIRVLLSKYRAYRTCTQCAGARLRREALWWRLGSADQAHAVLEPAARFRPVGTELAPERLAALPGLNFHDLMLLPIERCRRFFASLELPAPMDRGAEQLLGEIRARLDYLCAVGLGYLSLDRQSRTLSGGEVQRINLTTALGTSLVDTLFVLDEPSIGLHARDIARLIDVLRRLRDAGNSLLVVEHDAQVILAADRIVELGPGPGERGGSLVFCGTPEEFTRASASLTADYLFGRRRVQEAPPSPTAPGAAGWLELLGVHAHNLKEVDLRVPLGALMCLTGVSGSGKSTLVVEVLHRAMLKHLGRATEPPGAFRELRGQEALADTVLVDQAPIGKTARSNPASYVGALDGIRKLFARQPLARERGYGPGTFSFNAGNGRCAACGGSGFEHVEMQFLSDVYLRCSECDGRRYRAEILEVKWGGASRQWSIADVLEATVSEALELFSGHPEILRALQPLDEVGLGYLRLGQPVPTLSGGEAQRLKLAGHLVEAARGPAAGRLFLFDEPTTGLHFDDIARLLGALRRLVAAGHTVLVIEHNLDVIAAADWVVDLGPEGGEAGGEVVFRGPPAALVACAGSHTGAALRAAGAGAPCTPAWPAAAERGARYAVPAIRVRGAREHNLRNIDLDVPRERFTAITGVSGSGKSTVAFDILFAEGQRRYLESLNAYARQFVQPAARPDVDAVHGISPTVAIEQRTSRGGQKSTVATLTEVYHFLRLLYVKLGVQHCPKCELPIAPQDEEAIVARVLKQWRGRRVRILAPLVVARKGYYTDLARWAAARGYERLRVDGHFVPTDPWPRLDRYQEHDIELPVGELKVAARDEGALRDLVRRALGLGRGRVQVGAAGAAAGAEQAMFSTRRACPGCGRSFPEPDPRLLSFNSRHGWCTRCFGTGLEIAGFDAEQTGEERQWLGDGASEARTCRACAGQRLRPEALHVRFRERSIAEFTGATAAAALREVRALELHGREARIARDLLGELRGRLAFLVRVGLGYLELDRGAPSLSGGEAQRIRLAAQLGSNLRGVCYVLDEPTIGLHARDNELLLEALGELRARGNTVVVVEHDEATIRRAEHVIDLGPGAGVEGGRVVASGPVAELARHPESLTGRWLAAAPPHPWVERAPAMRAKGPSLRVEGARLHNLRDIDLDIPLGRLVCVTGVSGSGKSSLVRGVLAPALQALLARARPGRRSSRSPGGWREVRGHEHLGRVLEVDQTPIGKTPRSCPATYVGIWDYIRRLYAETEEARLRGYAPGRFSFNTRGGRCEGCEGQGTKRIEMSFLPDVKVPCEVCNGARFDPETLAARYQGYSVAEVLAMNAAQALELFSAHPPVARTLALLCDIGLGYLSLGQPSPTLSGGEAQRIKLVAELARVRDTPELAVGARTLYLLDEPTIGLHMADVEKLVRVLHRLVTAGHSVIVVEHNLDVIAEAHWVIDLGPEGGAGGGRVVAQGPPARVARSKRSRTAPFLRPLLQGGG